MEFFPALTDDHRDFIAKQPVFFVATAAAGARINCSPKGMDSFRVLGANRVAYLDLGGVSGRSCLRHDLNSAGHCSPDAGNETQAHLAADGRITVMFCAFDNPALILRMYGHGEAVLPQDDGFAELIAQFPPLAGTRQVFVIAVESVQTSCGWGVPRMTLEMERQTLVKYHAQQDPAAYLAKIAPRNRSIDGLPVRPQTQLVS